jgi:hypothetical protein
MAEIIKGDDLEDSLTIQFFITFLEYEEALTKDPATATRIKNVLINLGIWKN